MCRDADGCHVSTEGGLSCVGSCPYLGSCGESFGVNPDGTVDACCWCEVGYESPIPAASEWGLIVTWLLVMVAGTIMFRGRALRTAAYAAR